MLNLRPKTSLSMAESIEIQVLSKIGKARRGSLFFTENFLNFGTAKVVSKASERLAKQGELLRVTTGMYVGIALDSVIGPTKLGIEAISKAIAKRDKARIVPTGLYALNRLGLSTQVPLNILYLTDGDARKIKIGDRSITFKKTTPKNIAALGVISRLAIQALRTLEKDKITADEIEKIQQLLKMEKATQLILKAYRLIPLLVNGKKII